MNNIDSQKQIELLKLAVAEEKHKKEARLNMMRKQLRNRLKESEKEKLMRLRMHIKRANKRITALPRFFRNKAKAIEFARIAAIKYSEHIIVLISNYGHNLSKAQYSVHRATDELLRLWSNHIVIEFNSIPKAIDETELDNYSEKLERIKPRKPLLDYLKLESHLIRKPEKLDAEKRKKYEEDGYEIIRVFAKKDKWLVMGTPGNELLICMPEISKIRVATYRIPRLLWDLLQKCAMNKVQVVSLSGTRHRIMKLQHDGISEIHIADENGQLLNVTKINEKAASMKTYNMLKRIKKIDRSNTEDMDNENENLTNEQENYENTSL